MSEPMDYASAGVDIDLEGSAVASLIGALSKSVRQPGTPGAPVDLPGGFGGLIEFGDNLLAMATDGVGSKLQIATMLEQWGGVGIDCMAMNVNDLLCVGAEPIAFVDYVAVPKPDPAIHAALGASLAEACRLARVTLAGGETASLPGIVWNSTSQARHSAGCPRDKPSPANISKTVTCSSAARFGDSFQRLFLGSQDRRTCRLDLHRPRTVQCRPRWTNADALDQWNTDPRRGGPQPHPHLLRPGG